MGLRRHYVRPFFNGPCKATWISLCGFTDYFMYVYASYCMPFQHFEYYSMSFVFKDGAYYCYCAYVLHISRYSDFLSPILANTGIFLCGLKLSGESRY